ncbi:MAG: formyl transferase [Actinomycetota bacterium]|nr:formyl transferase [Actinomycetota bacterium]
MRAILMGKHKRSAVGALDHLVASGCEVAAVVCGEPGDAAPAQRIDEAASRHGLRLVGEDELLSEVADGRMREVDLVLSFLYPRRILAPLIDLGTCLNFHPAPLPDFRGLGGINVAIAEGRSEWGVSAHFVDMDFDTGDLVRVERFPIDPDRATALSLDLESQERLLALFRDVVGMALRGEPLPREPQGEGRYVTREEFEALRRVRPDDTPEQLARRIRAFWYPPYDGATLDVAGRTVTLVDRAILQEAAARYRAAGILP